MLTVEAAVSIEQQAPLRKAAANRAGHPRKLPMPLAVGARRRARVRTPGVYRRACRIMYRGTYRSTYRRLHLQVEGSHIRSGLDAPTRTPPPHGALDATVGRPVASEVMNFRLYWKSLATNNHDTNRGRGRGSVPVPGQIGDGDGDGPRLSACAEQPHFNNST